MYNMANWMYFWRKPRFRQSIYRTIGACRFTKWSTPAKDTTFAAIVLIVSNTIFNPGVMLFEAAEKIVKYFNDGCHLDAEKAEIWCQFANKALGNSLKDPLQPELTS